LEPFFLYANRIVSCWQTSDAILARQVGRGVPFQSNALVQDRNLGSGNGSAARIGDGTENGRKLRLGPRASWEQGK